MHNLQKTITRELADCALEYVAKGYSVFPLVPNGKEPALKGHWGKHATNDPTRVVEIWTDNPDYNIGVLCEELFVLDVDIKKVDGRKNLQTLLAKKSISTLEGKFEVITPSKGSHYYFRDEKPLMHTIKQNKPVEGCDIRSGGNGYVVGLGSVIDDEVYYSDDELPSLSELNVVPGFLSEAAQKLSPIRSVAAANDALNIEALLDQIDPSALDYTQWLQVGMAIHSENNSDEGLGLWVEWSSRDMDKFDEGACEKKWKSFESDGGITKNFLVSLVKTKERESSPLKLMEQNDSTIVKMVLEKYPDNFYKLIENNVWVAWDGSQWLCGAEAKKIIGKWVDSVIDNLVQQVPKIFMSDPNKATSTLKWLGKSKNNHVRKRVFDYLAERVPLSQREFDSNPNLVGVENGVFCLDSGQFRKRERSDMLTLSLRTCFDPGANCPQWESFLETTFEGDMEMIGYIQRLVGYFITPDISEQEIYFLYGDGGNGKSVFLDAIMSLLGDYGYKASCELVLKNKFGPRSNHALANIAGMQGKRLTCTDELSDGVLDSTIIKSLTGDDLVQGKRLHQNPVSYPATSKLVMYGNDKPDADFSDQGLWRRLRLIHFAHKVPREKVDKDLLKKLKLELPGILNWAIDGCLGWKSEGLNPPSRVSSDSEDYRKELDTVSQFVDECVKYDSHDKIVRTELFKRYRFWCENNSCSAVAAKKFYSSFRQVVNSKFVKEDKANGCWQFRGVTADIPTTF